MSVKKPLKVIPLPDQSVPRHPIRTDGVTIYELRAMVKGVYDVQALRTAMGQRICATVKGTLGLPPAKREKLGDKEAQKLLDKIRKEYRLMTEGLAHLPTPAKFVPGALISTIPTLYLVHQFIEALATERRLFQDISRVLPDFPFWRDYLSQVTGIGPAMGGVILSYLSPYLGRHPSSFWSYCGLDVAEDGAGRSRREEHLVLREYIDKDGELQTKRSVTYNPFVKAKMAGILTGSFLKKQSHPWVDIYYAEKNRLENHPKYGLAAVPAPGHRNRMACRKMVKAFLVELHVEWRKSEGLPVSLPYHEAKLGLVHGQDYASKN